MAEFQHRRQRHLGGGSAADPGDLPTRVTQPVPDELAGERADKIVAVLSGISRSAASRIIELGGIEADGRPVAGNERLAAGVVLNFSEPAEELGLQPDETVPFVVRYEDEVMAVIDKPAWIVVHPGAGRETGTLAGGVLARWPEIEGVGDEGRWGIVHRLDRETSGLLLIAKTAASHAYFSEAILSRSVSRNYVALAHGRLAMSTGIIDAPIGRDPARATRMALVPDGRVARTHYSLLAAWTDQASLLDVSLETGRTHQIRVHMSSIGHPLFDDRAYGTGGPKSGAGRLWLHAQHLEFQHPVTGEAMSIVSPLPPELEKALKKLGEPDYGALPKLEPKT